MTTRNARKNLMALMVAVAMVALTVAGTLASSAATADATPARMPELVKPSVTPPLSGSYSGRSGQNGAGVIFYVSSSRNQVQDFYIHNIQLSCAPNGTNPGQDFEIPSAAIKPNGSFSATVTEHGDFPDFNATFTYNLQGNFHGVQAAGTFRERISYNDNTPESCTSNNQQWTATRDSQPVQTTTAPPAGSFSGRSGQNGAGVSFYVSSSRNQVQDFYIHNVQLYCAPNGTNPGQDFEIPSAAIKPNGSFSATVTEHGDFPDFNATFTFTLQGNFHSIGPDGPRAAGTFRETLSYTDNTQEACTTDNQYWVATRDSQPTQTTAAPPAGSYTGRSGQNGAGVVFSVSKNHALQNFGIHNAQLYCTPNGTNPGVDFAIPSAAIKPDGSFNTTITQHGNFNGPATFTYTLRGNFHSIGPDGPRAAGTFRETVSYKDNTQESCTTDNQYWTATRAVN